MKKLNEFVETELAKSLMDQAYIVDSGEEPLRALGLWAFKLQIPLAQSR